MKTFPKRLGPLQIEMIKEEWSEDASRYSGEDGDGTGGHAIEELVRHIAFLEDYIKLLTREEPKIEEPLKAHRTPASN
jgi:hypothetical protein